jgi:hypothetical protein
VQLKDAELGVWGPEQAAELGVWVRGSCWFRLKGCDWPAEEDFVGGLPVGAGVWAQ